MSEFTPDASGDRSASTGTGDRRIILRRPPVLHMVPGPFVPDDPRVAEVDERWARFLERVPAGFDGPLLAVIGVHRNGHGGAVVHVAETSYRYYAVQDEGFDLGLRPLGAKGVTWKDGRVLMGLRAHWVAHGPGRWEFAPGGCVEPGESPSTTVARELREETGLGVVAEPVPVAMILDGTYRCWEMIHRVDAGDAEAEASDEYQELRWCDPGELPGPRTAIADLMAETCLNPRRDGRRVDRD